jgi:protocatechuate 4,5-dioxygenase beta chain/2'-aminobiphenyl-2,3-diol 1,2-dioxygenase large subunit
VGKIVGAFATSHVLGAPDGVEDQAERVFQGMREIGARLRALEPDVVVVLTSDHLNNFHVDIPAPFAVATDAVMTPYGDMGLPTDPILGAPDFTLDLAAFYAEHGFSVSAMSGVRPDHGVMIPHAICDPARMLPTALFYVNSVLDPSPSPVACWTAGGLLKRFVEQSRPADERVVLLAGGGLSHWLAVPQEGRVNEPWDRWFMSTLVSGHGEELTHLTNAEILEAAGNGGLEVAAWIAMAGAVPGARGEVIYYESLPSWASGMGGVALTT